MTREKAFKELVSGQKKGAIPFLTRGLLWILSFPYRWVVLWKNWRYDRGKNVRKASLPVVSIGNLTTGGTGKTPLVCYLALRLREAGIRVTILSRGYGANDSGTNDEALELEIRLPDVPHLQDPDRLKTAEIAADELGAQVLLLDDAFQHRRIHRDLDLLVIDATEPFGFGYPLPRGLLREPVKGLRRADFVVINRCNAVSADQLDSIKRRIHSIAPNMPIAEASVQAVETIDAKGCRLPISQLANKRCLAFCGIGNPTGFESTLKQAEIQLQQSIREYPDHHAYSREDIESLRQWVASQPDCETVLCTHKDLVKINLTHLEGKPLCAILISNRFESGEEQLGKAIDDVWKISKVNQGDEPVSMRG